MAKHSIPRWLVLCALLAAGCQTTAATGPEAGGGMAVKQAIQAKSFMVSTANPLAARAAYDILKRGGSALDAAIAAQMVLGLVEPQSSGIGGGGFLLHWDAARRKVTSYDGRETAPAATSETMFMRPDGTPMKRWGARVGGLAVGVPGIVAMLELAHRRHGRLPWKQLFAPAIALANSGFSISPRLHRMATKAKFLQRYKAARDYLFDADGKALPVGHRLVNKPYARTLKLIAKGGAAAFYGGATAREIVAAAGGADGNRGLMTLQDMAGYEAKIRNAVCAPYRIYRICGMGPPSTGGLTVNLILGQLERFDLAALGRDAPAAAHLFSQSSRLAYADRNRYMGDPDARPVPVAALMDRGYIRARAARIDETRDMGIAQPGRLPQQASTFGDATAEHSSTSHLSIVDARGNAVSFTTSIAIGFGSRVMASGFFLNNQLTDFAFRPRKNGVPHVNRPGPGKRPRSSMSPTMVFGPDGGLRLVIGSPGGTNIIGYVAKTIIAVLDWKMDVQSAIALPHYVNRNAKETELESGRAALRAPLEALGHRIKVRKLTSGLHGIEVFAGRLVGGADPRREGIVLGE